VDGLFRSNATARDHVRRRLMGLTAVMGITAVGSVGGLMAGLAPSDAGQALPVVAPTADGPAAAQAPGQQAAAAQQQQQPAVATSGSS
jgi:hypothetical protein